MSYTLRETLIASVINAAFSIAFFILVFGGNEQIALHAGSKFAYDFLPQAFFVGLFSALPVTIVTLKRLKAGKLQTSVCSSIPLPDSTPLRIITLAIISLVVFGGLGVGLGSLISVQLSYTSAMVLKAVYGVFITVIIAPLAICSALSQRT